MCEWAPSAGLRTSHRLQGVNGGFLGSWEICMLLSRFRCVQFFATPWTVARQAPLSMGILQARILEWVAIPFSRGSSQPRDGTCVFYVSCIGRQVLHPLSHTRTPLHVTSHMRTADEDHQTAETSFNSRMLP